MVRLSRLPSPGRIVCDFRARGALPRIVNRRWSLQSRKKRGMPHEGLLAANREAAMQKSELHTLGHPNATVVGAVKQE